MPLFFIKFIRYFLALSISKKRQKKRWFFVFQDKGGIGMRFFVILIAAVMFMPNMARAVMPDVGRGEPCFSDDTGTTKYLLYSIPSPSSRYFPFGFENYGLLAECGTSYSNTNWNAPSYDLYDACWAHYDLHGYFLCIAATPANAGNVLIDMIKVMWEYDRLGRLISSDNRNRVYLDNNGNEVTDGPKYCEKYTLPTAASVDDGVITLSGNSTPKYSCTCNTGYYSSDGAKTCTKCPAKFGVEATRDLGSDVSQDNCYIPKGTYKDMKGTVTYSGECYW